MIERLSLAVLLFSCALLLPLGAGAAQPAIDGDWSGTIVAGPQKLRIVFHIETVAAGISATLISVDQGGVKMPVATASRDGDRVVLDIPLIAGRFDGVLAPDGKALTGTWSQRGVAVPLALAWHPLGTPAPAQPATLPRPAGIAETDRSLNLGGDRLAGTLAYAGAAPSPPAVLMIAGSGPTDRNGNSPTFGYKADTQRLLAYGLALQGIASLRTDKRGVGGSAAAMHGEADMRVGNYVDDAKAWAKDLMARTGAKCVWLAGHSEGALIAELAARDNPDICGLILLAGPGRTMAEVLRAQLAHLPDDQRKSYYDAIDALSAGRTVDRPANDLLFRPSLQPYVLSEIALDPAALLKRLTVPVLIVQGDADRNILVEDAKALAAARPDATLLVVPGMTHALKLPPPGVAETDPSLPLAPGLVDTIASFIKTH
ncbi:MAG: alpha/beta fold hydrolase [Rhizomicrobium sp.]